MRRGFFFIHSPPFFLFYTVFLFTHALRVVSTHALQVEGDDFIPRQPGQHLSLTGAEPLFTDAILTADKINISIRSPRVVSDSLRQLSTKSAQK